VDTSAKKPLSLWEAKLSAGNIKFNVTPSPGATTCIFNGLSDAKEITETLGGEFEKRVV
jgi:malate dehydrogenase (quinone)